MKGNCPLRKNEVCMTGACRWFDEEMGEDGLCEVELISVSLHNIAQFLAVLAMEGDGGNGGKKPGSTLMEVFKQHHELDSEFDQGVEREGDE